MSGSRGRTAVVALGAIGTAVSAYLTWVHYSGSLALCVGAGGCEVVQASRYAMLGPVPVAVLGLAALAAMTALAWWRFRANGPASALTGLFALSLAGTVFVAYLTYLEVFVIRAICPWCASVAIAVVAILVLTVREAFATDRDIPSAGSTRP